MARPVTAKAPTQSNNEDYQSGNLVIKDDAIIKPDVIPSNNSTPNARPSNSGGDSGRNNAAYDGKTYTKEEVQQLIKDYSAQYDISAEVPLCIARLESGYNQFSKNKTSSASGVFQYLSGTWAGTDEGLAGLSVFDADANVRAAIKYMASRRKTTPWEVKNKCPKLSPRQWNILI